MSKPYESYESGDYLSKNPTWDEEDSEWKANEVIKILNRNRLSPKNVVDVGCGAGGILAVLHQNKPEASYSGFEIAADASKFWAKHEHRNIDFSLQDFFKETSHFDLLLLLDVIEHVPNPFEFLLALRDRSEYFVFHIPLDLSSISVARESPLLHVRQKVGHIHYFTKGLALSLIEESGYRILDWAYTGAAFSVPQPTWKGRLARLPRRLMFWLNRDWGVRLLGGETLIVLAKSS